MVMKEKNIKWGQSNLRAGTFTDRENTVLVRMEAHPDLAHGLGVSYGGREVTLPVKPPEETLPLIMTLCSVRQAPWYQVNQLTC